MNAPGARSAAQLAAILDATLIGDGDVALRGVASLDAATQHDVTFIRDARFAVRFAESNAGAAIITQGLEDGITLRQNKALLVVPDADHAMMKLLDQLAPAPSRPEPGVHPSAIIDHTATISNNARIGPHAHVGPKSTVGNNATLRAGVVIGQNVTIGDDADFHPNVVIYDNCTIDDRVILHSGVVVGADGFGYRPRADGRGVEKIPHIGAVRIQCDVEIGANTCIDRGKFTDTIVGRGTKIDNLVQIGHGCIIGQYCIICGQAALSGSVRLDDGVVLGGGAGVGDNITLGAGAQVGARSGVMSDIPAGETHMGYPAIPIKDFMPMIARTRRLPKILKRIAALEQAHKQQPPQ